MIQLIKYVGSNKKMSQNTLVLTYINVNVGDQLGCDVDTSLSTGAGWKICITVPTAADGVGVSCSRGGVLDTGGGDNAN